VSDAGGAAEPRDDRCVRLLHEHDRALRRLVASYERDPSKQQDLIQDIWLGVWQALPRFRGECSERTFVFRIAHNRAVSHVVKRVNEPPADELGEHLAADEPDPEQSVLSREASARVVEAMRRLPLPHRQVMTLLLEDLSYAEIAETLGISVSNVGVRVNRAKEQLRELLGHG
jgi:RNA polymerase sigma-70 factor (ECF subfamily)